MKILVVDDDRELVDLLIFALQRAAFTPVPAYDAATALRLLEREAPLLAILDVNLGSASGFDLLREFRQRSQIPVIMLTGRDAEVDKVEALEAGADDYLTKPFSHRELVARIRAVLRRVGVDAQPVAAPATVQQVGPIVLNSAEHSVTRDGQPLSLSLTEYRLLQYLMTNVGQAVPTRAILQQVWGYDDPTAGDVVRVTIHRLRRKLEEDSANPQFLHTIPGFGFMLKA
jgi:DNA-binding response OmpR family regulator